MICPVCGYTATRVNNTYWCPYDRIYLSNQPTVHLPIQETLPVAYHQVSRTYFKSKFLNIFIWVVMVVLYLIMMLLIVWSVVLNKSFDNSSIF